MVRLCLYPPSRAAASDGEDEDKCEAEKLILGHKPGAIPHKSDLGTYIKSAMRKTRSLDVYDYLRRLLDKAEPIPVTTSYYRLPPLPPPPMNARHLVTMAGVGDITMVRHLLSIGADPSLLAKPLLQAINNCNHEIVDLLLSRGADPNGCDKSSMPFCTPLFAAIRTGSVTQQLSANKIPR